MTPKPTQLFLRALGSGYLLVGVTAIYSIFSIPLALRHLSKEHFGLWALASQMTAYYALIDLGMTTSISRHLVEAKNDRLSGRYGSLILTGTAVTVVQAFIIILGGALLVFLIEPWLNIPSDLTANYRTLFFAQTIVIGLSFGTKIFNHIFASHQRFDISNFFGIINQLLLLLLLWFFFENSWGLLSFPLAGFFVWIVNLCMSLTVCWKGGFLPSNLTEWGGARWSDFTSMFAFGRDIFLMSIGAQIIFGSQTIILTRAIGLEAAAVWAICTKPFMLVCQLVWKIYEFAYIRFAELAVQENYLKLAERYKDLRLVIWVAAISCGALLTGLNSDFVSLWTGSSVTSWQPILDFFLGLWLVVLSMGRCDLSFNIALKNLGYSSAILLTEAFTFVLIACYLVPKAGIPGMIIISILCSLLFSFRYNRSLRIHAFRQRKIAYVAEQISVFRIAIFLTLSFTVGFGAQSYHATTWVLWLSKAASLVLFSALIAYFLMIPKHWKTALHTRLFSGLQPK